LADRQGSHKIAFLWIGMIGSAERDCYRWVREFSSRQFHQTICLKCLKSPKCPAIPSPDPGIRVANIYSDLSFVHCDYCRSVLRVFRLRNLMGDIEAKSVCVQLNGGVPTSLLLNPIRFSKSMLILKCRGMGDLVS
jgi:hypothetical protein